ncbi:hypothetical protein CASFOL_017186 [Castilleja foliolosa]|uniref:Uncharacterized protein n=1 Tax=Castilleja foliolosa TaxID=1961234 RepID=A0ABD3DDV4_9LAMI
MMMVAQLIPDGDGNSRRRLEVLGEAHGGCVALVAVGHGSRRFGLHWRRAGNGFGSKRV